MSCKCTMLEDIFCCKDELILSFYESRVIDDAMTRVKRMGFDVKIDNGALVIKLKNAESDVARICKDGGWSKAEQEGTTALLRDSTQPLSFGDIKSVKPLSQIAAISESSEITNIIRNKAFTSHFQPIVDVASGEIYGYEALLRGVRDDGSILPPNQILDTARRGDMLFYLDRAARETALKTAAVKRIDKKVFINFLPTAIYNPQNCLLDTVRWAMQLEFDPKNIVFEVVETEQTLDIEHLKRILDFYKNHGFMVALDDVGSGYSSLSMLSQIQPDIIKIDRTIIEGINSNSFKQSIFNALMKVSTDHGIMVLAEGVESLPEAEWITESGAHLAQGYFWGKPSAEPIRVL